MSTFGIPFGRCRSDWLVNCGPEVLGDAGGRCIRRERIRRLCNVEKIVPGSSDRCQVTRGELMQIDVLPERRYLALDDEREAAREMLRDERVL